MKRNMLIASSLVLALTACTDDYDAPTANYLGEVTVSGDAIVGETLSATVTDDNGLSGSTIVYSWMANNMAIAGATASTYTLTANELDKEITVTVTYTDDDDFDSIVKSIPTDEVENPITNIDGVLTIEGTTTEGYTLTAVLVDDNGVSGNVDYVWMADNAAISGATGSTYLLTAAEIGKKIKVSATYVDVDNFDESVMSAETAAVIAAPVNAPNVDGSVSISSANGIVVGAELTAAVVDPNGFSTATSIQWSADGVAISGANSITFTPQQVDLGKTLSVQVVYTDDNGYAEDVSSTASEMVFSYIVKNEAELATAVTSAVDGDYIALASAVGGDYENMAELNIAVPNLTLTVTSDSTAEITGSTCLFLDGSGITVDGLSFKDIDYLDGSICSDGTKGSVVMINSDSITLKNSTFNGDVGSTSEFNMVGVKGTNNIVERNLFTNMMGTRDKSGYVSMYSNDVINNNTVQYNVFKDIVVEASDRPTGAFALQVGRSTGSDSVPAANLTVQYNLFDNVQIDERLIKVQSSNNMIKGNTILNSSGMINLEDGAQTTVTNNVIMPTGDNADDGGIGFSGMGHIVTNNYIENSRTTSGDRSALFVHTDMMNNSGNQTTISAGVIDLTVTLANNTVVNARRGLQFDDKDCSASGVPSTILDADSNFIANESANDNGNNSEAVGDDDFVGAGCSVDASSDYDNNHFYGKVLSASGGFDFNGAAADNVSGGLDEATFTRNTAGLAIGSGADADVGADVSKLHVLLETEVGPNTTWTPNP